MTSAGVTREAAGQPAMAAASWGREVEEQVEELVVNGGEGEEEMEEVKERRK